MVGGFRTAVSQPRGSADTMGRVSLCWGGIFNSISGFYLLEASSFPLPAVMAKNVSRYY